MRYTALLLIAASLASSAMAEALTKEQVIVAKTILGEARGEGKAGMYAVACIIKQRMKLKSYPSTATGVCLEPKQFDYWTQHKRAKWDDINRSKVGRLMSTDTELVRYAKQLAVSLDRLDLSYIKNADHYCTLHTRNYWTKGRKPVAVIGGHKFFKLR